MASGRKTIAVTFRLRCRRGAALLLSACAAATPQLDRSSAGGEPSLRDSASQIVEDHAATQCLRSMHGGRPGVGVALLGAQNSTVAPRRRAVRCTASTIPRWWPGSRLIKGSSSRRSSGRPRRAWANRTRRRSPPDSSDDLGPCRRRSRPLSKTIALTWCAGQGGVDLLQGQPVCYFITPGFDDKFERRCQAPKQLVMLGGLLQVRGREVMSMVCREPRRRAASSLARALALLSGALALTSAFGVRR